MRLCAAGSSGNQDATNSGVAVYGQLTAYWRTRGVADSR